MPRPSGHFQISPEQRDRIARELKGSSADTTLACNLLEAVFRVGSRASTQDLSYLIVHLPGGGWKLRIREGIVLLTTEHLRHVRDTDRRRIRHVCMLFDKPGGRIEIEVGDPSGADPWTPAPPKQAALREPDWRAAGITDARDRTLIVRTIAEVHRARETMPLVRVWIEPIIDPDAPPPRVSITDDLEGSTASESDTEGGRMPESCRLGYAVAFSGLDSVPLGLLEHLQDTLGPRVLGCYGWLAPPPGVSQGGLPLLVVNLRRDGADAGKAGRHALGHTVRGDPLQSVLVNGKRTRGQR